MSVTRDIAQTYRRPGAVVTRLAEGKREDRVLIFLLLAAAMIFVAQAPWQARLAHYDPDPPLQARLYWSGFWWIFLFPLVLYVIATVLYFVLRVPGFVRCGFDMRLSVFWALLATAPVILFMGMIAGFIGPGAGLNALALIWLALFMWFCIAGLNALRTRP